MKKIKQRDQEAASKFRLLRGLNLIEYDKLIDEFDLLIKRKLSLYTLKVKRRKRFMFNEPPNSLGGSRKKLDFILMYLKENPNQHFHAYLFDMCQSKVSEWINFILPVLEETLKKLSLMPQTGTRFVADKSDSDLLIDVTERIVPRRSDHEAQKEEYSGKKKIHTIKNLAVTNNSGVIRFISESYLGKIHDKAIWDDIDFQFNDSILFVDLGFKGVEKDYVNVRIPHKKRKLQELNDEQKKENKEIGRKRITVEHAFGGVKILKIIRDKIRLKYYEKRDLVFRIASALHNLRLTMRKPILNES